jgi:shikimate dehydrogenase
VSGGVAGVIGWPVEHSLSPAIHEAAYRELDMDWRYVRLPVAPGMLLDALKGLVALGFAGANVTMPHKTAAAELIGSLSEDAALLKAVNTVVVSASGLRGENTDRPGFQRFLEDDAGSDPAGRTATIFGAGGAARACALALARMGIAQVWVAVRDAARATEMMRVLEEAGAAASVVGFDEAPEADIIVNATPLGMSGEPVPAPEMGPGTVAVDLQYKTSESPFLLAAREAGASAFGGLGLLTHQAAISFELFTGRPAPIEVMSAAAIAAMA